MLVYFFTQTNPSYILVEQPPFTIALQTFSLVDGLAIHTEAELDLYEQIGRQEAKS